MMLKTPLTMYGHSQILQKKQIDVMKSGYIHSSRN